MPTPKSEFPELFPCDFYAPRELLEGDRMYTVYEIARLLQGLDPDAEIDEGTEDVLLDWAIPWVMLNADELVVAEPRTDDEPGYYGLKAGDADGSTSEATRSDGTSGTDDASDGDSGGDDGTGTSDSDTKVYRDDAAE